MNIPLSHSSVSSIKRILVIKLGHHGDVLLTTPVFTNLKKYFKNASIDALIYEETASMLQGHHALNQLLICPHHKKKQSFWKKLSHDGRLFQRIRRSGYDLIINLTKGDRGLVATWISKARFKVGREESSKKFFGRKRASYYTHIAKTSAGDRHVVEINLDSLRVLGIHPGKEERRLVFNYSFDEQERVRSLLMSHDVPLQQFIHIHPTSRWLFKSLPSKTIGDVIAHFEKKGLSVVLTAAPVPSELKMIEQILQYTGGLCINLSGKLSLKELGALISFSKIFIGVDSAPMHMAAALQKPTVGIFGPSSERAWTPWDMPGNAPYAEVVAMPMSCRPCGLDGCGGSKVSDCLKLLPPQWIIDAAERALVYEPQQNRLPLAFNPRLRVHSLT